MGRNSRVVAAAGSENPPTTALTEVQLAAFWAGIVANTDAARRMARKVVPKQDADDVITTAAIMFLESLQGPGKPAKIPADDDEFRRRYLAIVHNHAVDCVRGPSAAESCVHAQWGIDPEPIVGGRKTPDRSLDRVFARNDLDAYDAPAPDEVRAQDDVDELGRILDAHISALTRMQRIVVTETYLDGRKRAEVAARNGISVKTYDNHLQAAFATLRDELWYTAYCQDDVDRSAWADRIEELSDLYDDAFARRVARDLERLRRLVRNGPGDGGEGGTDASAGAA